MSICRYKYKDIKEREEHSTADNDQQHDNDEVDTRDLIDAISPGNYIAVCTTSYTTGKFKMFIVNEILRASDDIIDSHQHFILKGMVYLACSLLGKVKDMQSFTQ